MLSAFQSENKNNEDALSDASAPQFLPSLTTRESAEILREIANLICDMSEQIPLSPFSKAAQAAEKKGVLLPRNFRRVYTPRRMLRMIERIPVKSQQETDALTEFQEIQDADKASRAKRKLFD